MDADDDWDRLLSDDYDIDREEDMWRSNMQGADLSGSRNFYDANLTESNLCEANLDRADLHRAHLARADLRDASMRGTDLSGADLSGAKLEGVVWSSGPEGTRWPERLAKEVQARSQEIAPGVWKVAKA